jgi:nucleoside-diphosphate kinase
VNWNDWSVVVLKPDCVDRGLVAPVLEWVAREVHLVARLDLVATEAQVVAHYDDMLPAAVSADLGVDVPAELRRIFVGRHVTVALGYGTDAAVRLRALHGPTDPATAGPHTIRGRFAGDSIAAARSQGRLVNNLIHTSDTAQVVGRDLAIWFGPDATDLLRAPAPLTPGGTA